MYVFWHEMYAFVYFNQNSGSRIIFMDGWYVTAKLFSGLLLEIRAQFGIMLGVETETGRIS